MQQRLPGFSAVILAHDHGRWERAARSLLAQTRPAVRTIVVCGDGRSPAGPTAVPAELQGVRFVCRPPEGLRAVCHRLARHSAQGADDDAWEYAVLLDGDDEPFPTCLEHLARAAGSGGGRADAAGVVRCGALWLRADGLVDGVALPPPTGGRYGRPNRDRMLPLAVHRELLAADGVGRCGPALPGGGAVPVVSVPRLLVRRRRERRLRSGEPGDPFPWYTGLPTTHTWVPGELAGRRGRRPEAVSVVIPVRNAVVTLPQQLRALAGQTYRGPWEVLVADNGSTDRSRAVVLEARSWCPGLRLVEAADRTGESHARNSGAAAARGDFLAFCDADDIADPGWLAALVAAARDADLVGGALDVGMLNPAHCDEQPLPMTAQGEFLPFARGANCGVWRDVLTAVGGWDESYRGGGEDMDLSWRAQLCDFRVGYAPDARMHYRLRTAPVALARQKWNYGKSGARLFRSYRDAGFRRRRPATVVGNWVWLCLHLPDLVRSRGLRRRWIRYAARLGGLLAGSIRHRAGYL